jgi:hypothetical protein
MVASGSCPTANFSGNWIASDFQAGTNTNDTQDAYGTAAFVINGASSSATITQRSFVTGTAMSDSTLNFDSANCANGTLDVGGGVEMYLSTAGAALVKTPGSFIFATPKQSADVVAADLDGTYSGVAFIADGGSKQIPVKVVFSGGTGTATQLTDIQNDTLGSGTVAFSAISPLASSGGIFSATAVNDSDTGRVNCATFTYGGKRVIGCNGFFRDDSGDADGDSNTTEKAPFFFVARAR